eukprot:4596867-Lingulodinium_polyedra.AAC.1
MEEEETTGNAVPVVNDCLVLGEEMVAGAIIKPEATELVPSSPANALENIASVFATSIGKNEEENTGNETP